ncbi:hypothetical protein WJX73_008041 [Symbiochloris irregularis]|uniref:Uncharacterized protein n=1 Tax=Symbiochloris irregularis TaxID=706552 RepID=A0AAW1NPN9_9CHLO
MAIYVAASRRLAFPMVALLVALLLASCVSAQYGAPPVDGSYSSASYSLVPLEWQDAPCFSPMARDMAPMVLNIMVATSASIHMANRFQH